jgi:hypothetical protein
VTKTFGAQPTRTDSDTPHDEGDGRVGGEAEAGEKEREKERARVKGTVWACCIERAQQEHGLDCNTIILALLRISIVE